MLVRQYLIFGRNDISALPFLTKSRDKYSQGLAKLFLQHSCWLCAFMRPYNNLFTLECDTCAGRAVEVI